MSAFGGKPDIDRGMASCPLLTQSEHRPLGFAYRSVMEYQSGFAPENLTTLPHFSVSSAISLPKSPADPASGVPPRSASRAFIRGLARAVLISLLSRSMISGG